MIGRISVIADGAGRARPRRRRPARDDQRRAHAPARGSTSRRAFPGAELDDAQHLARFSDCLAYAPRPPSAAQREQLLQAIDGIAALPDVRALVPMLIVRGAPER